MSAFFETSGDIRETARRLNALFEPTRGPYSQIVFFDKTAIDEDILAVLGDEVRLSHVRPIVAFSARVQRSQEVYGGDTYGVRLERIDRMVDEFLTNSVSLDVYDQDWTLGLERIVSLRIFSRFYDDICDMIEDASGLCDVGEPKDQFDLMLECFTEYVKRDDCDIAVGQILLGFDVEDGLFDGAGEDGLFVVL
jgi:hypothetical protein